ncbi:hypothetical protein SAMD00019534_122800 [Acytostelium subglobosum LB1]|uniref:hypothetical protein n=1 Tax=Acytostelium subglobosum LB1 TaxID=1410327 RepID=UPI000645022E|nr:hypothetical protein SAMD00019534_122800 [Acytostelium subglobosum LB1]GAM29104.1 hypothetical protein SAMD00019534_122800 [Acytostelium subglobosum LB1]|eukprot:XP_012747949.1 hypothetical protein SAMD00019534_122800 [Acytostelium subglobosum LB1]
MLSKQPTSNLLKIITFMLLGLLLLLPTLVYSQTQADLDALNWIEKTWNLALPSPKCQAYGIVCDIAQNIISINIDAASPVSPTTTTTTTTSTGASGGGTAVTTSKASATAPSPFLNQLRDLDQSSTTNGWSSNIQTAAPKQPANTPSTTSPYSMLYLVNIAITKLPVNLTVMILNDLYAPNLQTVLLNYSPIAPPPFTADIVTAFPNLLAIDFLGPVVSGKAPTSLFQHPLLQRLTIKSNLMFEQLLNVTSNNVIGNLDIILDPSIQSPVLITQSSLPKVTNLTLNYKASAILNIQIPSLSILTLNGLAALPKVELTINTPLLNKLSIFNSDAQPIVGSLDKLTEIYLNHNAPRPSIFFTSFPPALTTYSEQNTPMSNVSLPPATDVLKTLILSGNQISLDIAKVTYWNLDFLDLSNNQIRGNGSQPSLCSIARMNMVGNQITAMGECFYCYKSYIAVWFDASMVIYTPSTECGYINNAPSGGFVVRSDLIYITGKNLGWGGFGTTSGLTPIIPNFNFTFKVPETAVKNGTISIKFSAEQPNQTFPILMAAPTVDSASFIQMENILLMRVSGVNVKDIIVRLNGETLVCFSRDTSFVSCQVRVDLPEGTHTVGWTDSPYPPSLSYNFTTSYFRSFPLVSGVSAIGQSGGSVTITGTFYANGVADDNTTVTVDGVNCPISSMAASQVVCDLKPTKSLGKVRMVINNAGFLLDSSRLFYISPDTVACPQGCGTGICQMGLCTCPVGYYGPDCSYQQTPVAEVEQELSETTPSSTTILANALFQFNITSIEELDSLDAVVNNQSLIQWTTIKTESDIKSTVNYSTVTSHGANVTAIFDVYKTSSTVTFAGITRDYIPGTLKVSLVITGWKFQKSSNVLRVVVSTSSSIKSAESTCGADQTSEHYGQDSLNNLNYLVYERNDVTFYGRFINRSMSDGRPTFSATNILSQSSDGADNGTKVTRIGIYLPMCNECILDPDFSVLVNPHQEANPCASNNKSNYVIVAAVCGSVGFVLVVVIIVAIVIKTRYYVHRHGNWFKLVPRAGERNRALKKLRGASE